MKAEITISNYCNLCGDENDSCFIAMEAGITINNYCDVSNDENDACFIAMEAGITISNYCDVSSDENDACFIAMEAGITKVITEIIVASYTVMKMTRASLKWKRVSLTTKLVN